MTHLFEYFIPFKEAKHSTKHVNNACRDALRPGLERKKFEMLLTRRINKASLDVWWAGLERLQFEIG